MYLNALGLGGAKIRVFSLAPRAALSTGIKLRMSGNRLLNLSAGILVAAVAGAVPQIAEARDPRPTLDLDVQGPNGSYDAPLAQASMLPAASVPLYNSRPGAAASLFLDFDGIDFGTTSWGASSSAYSGRPGVQPAYSTDTNTSVFSSGELSNIFQIWSRVAEAYSPFNINVTTVNPGNYTAKRAAHVVISGNGSWYGSAGGVAYVGGFQSGGKVYNTGWAFEDNLSNGNIKTTADATIHEAGHMFDLDHQSAWSGTTKTEEYENGNNLRAPIMGIAYGAQRGLWRLGQTSSSNSITAQSNLGTLSGTANGFGYAPDEAGTSLATAQALAVSGLNISGQGVISQSSDGDFFEFTTGDGVVNLFVDVAQYGPMLDAKLNLYTESGSLIASVDPSLTTARSSLTAGYSGYLSTGTYIMGITSAGGWRDSAGNFYHDTGQYFISGTVVAVPEPAVMGLLAMAPFALLRRRRLIGH